MQVKKFLTVLLLTLSPVLAKAQDAPISNVQTYTPSKLFGKDHWEFKNFYNVYTQTKAFEGGIGKVPTMRERETYLTVINQFLYGINKRINMGGDIWVKYVNDGTGRTRTAVTGIGPKIKLAPLKKIPYFSVQSTFLFPLDNDLESRATDAEHSGLFLAFDRYLWINQFFYDRTFKNNWQLFLQFSVWTSFVRKSFRTNDFVETPASAFLSYLPNRRITIYGMTEFWPRHTKDDFQAGGISNNTFKAFSTFFAQSGLGLKYQIIQGVLEAELLYTYFWLGSEGEGAGQTFNLGLRIVQ